MPCSLRKFTISNRFSAIESFRITENREFCDFFRNMFHEFFNEISPSENKLLSSAQKLSNIEPQLIGVKEKQSVKRYKW